MNKLVSIIIPVFNVEKYVEKCILSCLNQTYKNVEIILIDDGSTDNSLKIIRKFKSNEKVKIISKKNGGVSSARNEGLKVSNGEYITFVDADDYLSSEYVEYMVNLIKDSDFAISSSCYTSVNQEQNKSTIEILGSIEAVNLLLSQKIIVGCWNKIYKMKIIKDNALKFDESLFYGEGLHFINTYAQFCNNVSIGNRRVYYYRKDNMNSATTKYNYKKYENGEMSLFKIKNEFRYDFNLINIEWTTHYCIFCLNSIIDIILNNEDNRLLKVWKKKVNVYLWKVLLDFKFSLKLKLKLILVNVNPKLISLRVKQKRKQAIMESVK